MSSQMKEISELSAPLHSYCHFILQVSTSGTLMIILVLSTLFTTCAGAPSQAVFGGSSLCSRKSPAHWSCVIGCFKCADTFGRREYDMASCCAECTVSGALLVDDGPEFCSERFFTEEGVLRVIKGKR